MRARLFSVWFPGALLAVAAACGDATGPSGSGITVVAAPALSDTIDAMPSQPLTVEIAGGQGNRSGLSVRFESIPGPERTSNRYSMLFRAMSNTYPFLAVASDTTDSMGRVNVRLRFGTVAGDAKLVVSCPALGVSDTLQFTVRAGAPGKVRVAVRDTTLAPGGQYSLGGYLTDRWDNPVSGTVYYLPWENVASVDASGLVTAGQAVGRGSLLVRAVGGPVDTARFTVVPKVQAAMFWESPTMGGQIVRANLDGTSRKVLTTATGPAFPSPSPTSEEVAYQQVVDDRYAVFVVDGNGVRRLLLDPSVMAHARNPQFSADGQRVYLIGLPSGGSTYSVWRVRRDGTSLERLVDLSSFGCEGGGRLAVSPDESRVAYCDGIEVIILTIATGAKTVIGTYGSQPAFSRDGARVAFTRNNSVVLVNKDGSPDRTLFIPGWSGSQSITWLPGNGWLLLRADLPTLVSTSGGERAPIPTLKDYHQISVVY